MCILFWFVVHLCQTLKNTGGWRGVRENRMVKSVYSFWSLDDCTGNIFVIYMFLVEILCSTNRKPLHLYCEPHWISTSLFVFKSSFLCISNCCEHLKVLNLVTTAVFIQVFIHSIHSFIHFIQNINEIAPRWFYSKMFFF